MYRKYVFVILNNVKLYFTNQIQLCNQNANSGIRNYHHARSPVPPAVTPMTPKGNHHPDF